MTITDTSIIFSENQNVYGAFLPYWNNPKRSFIYTSDLLVYNKTTGTIYPVNIEIGSGGGAYFLFDTIRRPYNSALIVTSIHCLHMKSEYVFFLKPMLTDVLAHLTTSAQELATNYAALSSKWTNISSRLSNLQSTNPEYFL